MYRGNRLRYTYLLGLEYNLARLDLYVLTTRFCAIALLISEGFVGGILSFLLSRKGRRTVIPSVLVAITGIIELFKPKADSQFVVTSTLCSLLVGASILRCTEIVLDTSKAQGVHSSRWKSASSMAFVSAGVVYMTLSPDLLEAMGFQQFYTFSYLGFILGMSLALVGFLLFLGHLYGTTGRNARGHATSRASIQFRPSPVERNVSTPLDGGDMASKFVVTDDSDEDEESGMLRRNGVQEYPLHATHHEALRNGHLEDDEELRERA
ncbi:hypothetical protein FRC14_003990 [Serendipita sp. 396]|nr:hypothetical protein FRC14_003990 [Serendipita sp. 396]